MRICKHPLVSALSQAEHKKIVSFLSAHPVGVLATVDPEGNPQASTIYIAVDNSLNITFTTKRETRKYKNISENNKVVLVVYEAESQTAVQVAGQAIEVTDPEAQRAIYYGTIQAAQQTGKDTVPPIAKIIAGPYVGFTIQVDTIWLSSYGWGDNFANALKHANDPPAGGDPA